MELIYNRLEHCTLLDVLKNKEINQSLAYMVDFKEYKNLKVIPNTYSIEISNNKITIIVILLIGFELEEYQKLKEGINVHIVSFNEACQTVFEFKKFKSEIKQLNFMSLFFETLSRSKSKQIQNLVALKNLSNR